jgi:hypothetical protein
MESIGEVAHRTRSKSQKLVRILFQADYQRKRDIDDQLPSRLQTGLSSGKLLEDLPSDVNNYSPSESLKRKVSAPSKRKQRTGKAKGIVALEA